MKMQHLAVEGEGEYNPHKSLSQYILSIMMQYSHFNLFNKGIEMTDEVKQAFKLHLGKIDDAIKKEEKISFILPAFPAKSPNREKTLSYLPDMGEYLALKRLHEACEKIAEVYSIGAKVVICSDGRVFSDLVSVEDEQVTLYGLHLLSMIKSNQFSNIEVFNLEDAFISMNYDDMRSNLCELYPKSVEDIRSSIATDAMEKNLFNGIHRFMFEDLQVLKSEKSNTQNRNEAKTLAYGVIHRSHAWSRYVENVFPASVRLSIHPQGIETNKIGIQLVDCGDVWGTPWHNVALHDGESFSLVKHKDALAQGARLVESAQGYQYFAKTAI